MINCIFQYRTPNGPASDSIISKIAVLSIPQVGDHLLLLNSSGGGERSTVSSVTHEINLETGEQTVRIQYS